MRQFDPDLALDRVLERGELAEDGLDAFGADLAVRHARLPEHRGSADEVPVAYFRSGGGQLRGDWRHGAG